jgi:hypothetical protein
MSGAIPPLPSTPSWPGALLKKSIRDYNFTLFCTDVKVFLHTEGITQIEGF